MAFEDILRNLLSRPDAESRRRYLSSLEDAKVERAASHLFCHIDIHIAEGHRTAADTMLRVAEDIADLFEGEVFPYLCCRRRARLCRKYGDERGALEAYRKAWRILAPSDLHEAKVEVLMELGILHDVLNDHHVALQHFRQAKRICKRHGLVFNLAAAYFNIASIYSDLSEDDRFNHYTRRVARLDKEHGFPSHRARLELLLANYNDRRGQSAQSMEHYRKALDAYRQIHDRLKASEILAHLGEVARISGQEDVTGPLLGEALAERRALDAREAEGRFYFYRGVTAWQVGLVEEAAQHYQYALERFSGLCGDAEQETRYRLYQCLRALGRAHDHLPAFLENRGSATDPEPEELPHDPHVGSPHPPLQFACDSHGRPESYRAPNGDGASLEDFHRRKKTRGFVVERSDLTHLMNALAAWMKQEGRRDLARQLRREAKVIEGWLRRRAPSGGRKTTGRNN